jgi:hypothetical protein
VKVIVLLFGEQVTLEQDALLDNGSTEAVMEAMIDAAAAVDNTGIEPDDELTDEDISELTGIIDNPWGDQGEDGFASGTMG